MSRPLLLIREAIASRPWPWLWLWLCLASSASVASRRRPYRFCQWFPRLRLAMPGLKSQKEPGQRRQVLDHAKHMLGLRFRTEIWMLRLAKAWPRSCPSAVQASCALNLAFPFRPSGFNGGEDDSDSLDTSDGFSGARDLMRMEQFLLTIALQRLRHQSRRRLKALALMPWALSYLGLDGQAIHIWPPC